MGHINPKGRDWGSLVNWDDVGKSYGGFSVAWSIILFIGICWLIAHRHLSFVKVRNVPLAIAATVTLHVYLVKVLLAYTVNGHFPCNAEFWIMSIYLPFGIALFQANMAQLHSISTQQQKLLVGQQHLPRARMAQRRPGLRGFWGKWRAMTPAKRTEAFIAAGMVLQLVVTTAIFVASRKFHSSFGFGPANPKPPVCRKGWEWIPSIIWQLVWSFIYGPYILYKIRNIDDVHYWRLQITICVISSLPGVPLWLAAVYSDKFKPVNRYWVPPTWLAPGIIMMQGVTIFFPIFEAYRSRYKLRRTLSMAKGWGEKRPSDDSTINSGSSRSLSHSVSVGKKFSSTSNLALRHVRDAYSMAALDKALMTNATPLLHFAATKEFTGENIVFLTQVRNWRTSWTRARKDSGAVTGHVLHYLFNLGLEIFMTSVSEKTADFPVNITGKMRSDLEAVFGPAVSDLVHDCNDNIVDPFNYPSPSSSEPGQMSLTKAFDAKIGHNFNKGGFSVRENALSEFHDSILPSNRGTTFDASACILEDSSDTARIPAGFGEHVFDEAEQEVKYMVLTNTWPRFVDSCKVTDI